MRRTDRSSSTARACWLSGQWTEGLGHAILARIGELPGGRLLEANRRSGRRVNTKLVAPSAWVADKLLCGVRLRDHDDVTASAGQ